MHTAEWWWETQKKLLLGATVVSIIIGTDKTLMTKLYGNVSAWPVYLTIGNLSRTLRRKQTLLSKLLVGFIPITKDITKKLDNERN